jgi:hypothetical protein
MIGFQRRRVRFQHRDLAAEVGDFAPEVILLNSQDCSSGYQIHAGLFRWVCRGSAAQSQGYFELQEVVAELTAESTKNAKTWYK